MAHKPGKSSLLCCQLHRHCSKFMEVLYIFNLKEHRQRNTVHYCPVQRKWYRRLFHSQQGYAQYPTLSIFILLTSAMPKIEIYCKYVYYCIHDQLALFIVMGKPLQNIQQVCYNQLHADGMRAICLAVGGQ